MLAVAEIAANLVCDFDLVFFFGFTDEGFSTAIAINGMQRFFSKVQKS